MSIVNVTGTVERLHKTGNGFSLRESRSGAAGATYTTFWAVFPSGPEDVQPGDTVSVSGFLGTSVSAPKPDSDKRYVDHTVSSAKVHHAGSATTAATAPPAAPEDPWAGGWSVAAVPEPPGGMYDETPF